MIEANVYLRVPQEGSKWGRPVGLVLIAPCENRGMREDEEKPIVAFSICSRKDNFSKKIARTICRGRLQCESRPPDKLANVLECGVKGYISRRMFDGGPIAHWDYLINWDDATRQLQHIHDNWTEIMAKASQRKHLSDDETKVLRASNG
jgi:hypothetical protein